MGRHRYSGVGKAVGVFVRRRIPVGVRPEERHISCNRHFCGSGTQTAAVMLGLSAGASAPEIIVDEIIDAFSERFSVTVELAETAVENENFPVMQDLRDIALTASDMAFVNGGKSDPVAPEPAAAIGTGKPVTDC